MPAVHQESGAVTPIGWRMGYGEDYIGRFSPGWKTFLQEGTDGVSGSAVPGAGHLEGAEWQDEDTEASIGSMAAFG